MGCDVDHVVSSKLVTFAILERWGLSLKRNIGKLAMSNVGYREEVNSRFVEFYNMTARAK